MINNWGGNREGSGRKKLDEDMKKKGYTFYLTEDEIEFIEDFEGNSRSECLRNMILKYKILK